MLRFSNEDVDQFPAVGGPADHLSRLLNREASHGGRRAPCKVDNAAGRAPGLRPARGRTHVRLWRSTKHGSVTVRPCGSSAESGAVVGALEDPARRYAVTAQDETSKGEASAVTRKSGKNPPRARILRGIPRTVGPTLVNGEKVRVERPHVAISRMYRTIDRHKAYERSSGWADEAGNAARTWQDLRGRELPERRRTCRCGQTILRSQHAVLHRRRGQTHQAYHWRCRPPECPL